MTGLPPDPQRMQSYIDLVYGSAHGYSLIGFGVPVLRDGKYAHEPFRQMPYRLPEDRGQLIVDACTAALPTRTCSSRRSCVTGPTARSVAVIRCRVATSGWTWTTGRPTSPPQLIELGLPCHLLDSGGIGLRRHCYIDVGEVLPGEDIAHLSKRLAAVLGTDTAGGNNKLLRLPGTWNHKGRLLGDGARPVTWLPPLNVGAPASPGPLEALLRAREATAVMRSTSSSVGELPSDQIPPDGGEEPCERVLHESDGLRKALTAAVRHEAIRKMSSRLRQDRVSCSG